MEDVFGPSFHDLILEKGSFAETPSIISII